nr:cuticle protein CP14.6-like [Leptinotarsa decemlineata]
MMHLSIILLISIVSVQGEHGVTVGTLVNKKEQNEDGYHFKFSTSDGQNREETGVLSKLGDNLILRVVGFYSYKGDDGNSYQVTYRADDTGFTATGDHLPTLKTYYPKITSSTTEFPQEIENPILLRSDFLPRTRIASSAIASLAGGGLG